MNLKIKTLVRTGILTAMIFVLTAVVSIGMPFGYINLSDFLIMILSGLEEVFPLAFMASFGTMLADLYLGYSQYAIFTFVVKLSEALVMFYLFKKIKYKYGYILVFLIGALIMLVGYGLSDVILTNNIATFALSFVANLPQAISCYIIAIAVYPLLKKVYRY